jgi:hypothetical protein
MTVPFLNAFLLHESSIQTSDSTMHRSNGAADWAALSLVKSQLAG